MSSRRSGARVEARAFVPAADLRDVVESIWTGRWDLRGQEPHTTELLGDPCVHLVFEASDARREARVVGVWTRMWTRTLEGRGKVWGIKLRAGAAGALLEAPATRWTDAITRWSDEVGLDPGFLTEVLAPGRDEEVVARLEAWARAHRRDEDDASIAKAVGLMARVSSDEAVRSVAQLAREEGVSVRVLQRLFRQHVGAPPKWALMRRRVQEATVRIEREPEVDLAALALDLGYADQAHLTRDFVAMTKRTPRGFAAQVWA